MDLGDNDEELRRQLDHLEDGGFVKYKAYLDVAQLNLEVRSLIYRKQRNYKTQYQNQDAPRFEEGRSESETETHEPRTVLCMFMRAMAIRFDGRSWKAARVGKCTHNHDQPQDVTAV